MAGERSYGILISKLKNWKIRKLKRVCRKDGARRTKDEQMTVRAARADREMRKVTSPLHIPSFRWLPQRGGM